MQLFEHTFKALGGTNVIKLCCEDSTQAQHGFQIAQQEVQRIEAKFSRYRADSVLSQINDQAAVKPILVDDETADLLNYADTCFQQSAGLFDITSGVLRECWDFNKKQLPSSTLLDEILTRIGWQKVQWQNKSIHFTHPGMQLDFGGIGKEYAVDRVCALLKQLNFKDALVNLSGDIGALGERIDHSAWRVGVQHPRSTGSIADIELSNACLATSGDYERFIELNGKRYCHILNPKTGWPVQDLQSVTVYGNSCLVAGSVSTITMLLGESAGLQFLRDSALEFLVVTAQGEIITS